MSARYLGPVPLDTVAPIKSRRRGKWALIIFLVVITAALGGVWLWPDVQRQDKLIRTAPLGLAAGAGFLLWVVFGSGWPRRARWTVFIGCGVVMLFCRFGLRISGVTGDLLPIVELRWTRTRSEAATELSPASLRTNPLPAVVESATNTFSYPQFLGPQRNGVLPGPSLARDWSSAPPQELWRCAVGAAWSGFALVGSRALTQEQRGPEELVTCRDAQTGTLLWSHADPSRYATTIAGEGPRATPTILSNRVFTLGGAGVLNCLDLATGKVLWSTNTLAQFGLAKPPDWGVACSPLLHGSAVIVTVGGAGHTLVAYDQNTGAKLWNAGTDEAQWSSPIHAVLAGVPQILTFNDSLAAHDPQTGRVLWQHPWPGAYPRVTVPLLLAQDRVLLSTGYGAGAELLQITRDAGRWHARRLWKSIRMKSKFGNLFHLDGYIYGLDDGALACIDVNTGELKWKGERYGHGQMILVDKLLLLTAENGDLVLIEPHPSEPRELARHKVFTAKTWNPPALAGDLLLVRNDREAVALRLPLALTPARQP